MKTAISRAFCIVKTGVSEAFCIVKTVSEAFCFVRTCISKAFCIVKTAITKAFCTCVNCCQTETTAEHLCRRMTVKDLDQLICINSDLFQSQFVPGGNGKDYS